ncbi:MAG: WD40 repeat domain-containing protein [Thermosynechococcaceae cyanobacterium MS004]|nr:WD40 repeat domain-containing protein [Thermosynechococcaceae cyanobacterium MS004]
MTDAEALALVDRLLQATAQSSLSDLQSAILQGVWVGHSYQKLADCLGYEVDYIKQIAARLWKQLATITGEEVSKRNLQSVLRRYQESHLTPNHHLQDWGEASDISHFYGRQSDLHTLEAWALSTRCRLIGIFGIGGIGKTTLSVKLAQTVQTQFDCLIWRSLRQAPPLPELLNDIVPLLMGAEVTGASVAVLMEQLQQKRCLLVLDNVESILQSGNRSGQYLTGYEDYGQLFERICDQPHQSCVILTGREKPGGIAHREGQALPVRSLQIQGLPAIAAQQILIDRGLSSTPQQYQVLVNYFGGNPLALKLAATTIQTLFGGDIQTYMAEGSTVFSNLWDLLDQQFQRLSPLQQQVMYWFAINREGITASQLQAEFLPKQPLSKLLEVLESLHQQSLLESTEMGLTQQPVIMEYVTDRFIEAIEQELIHRELNLLRTHVLLEAQTQDYLREAQTQLIVCPLAERLLAHFGDQTQLEQHLYQIVDSLRATPAHTGYAGGNLLNLFGNLKTNLKGFNFSGLFVRQAHLLNAALHEVDFTDAQFSQTVFAETFGGVVGVAFSPDGKRFATSDTKGDIQIWDAQTGAQIRRCRGHQHWTWDVAFSPNGQYLASASDDYRVKLWDVETGQCLQTYEGHTNSVNAVAFSPNGQIIASCGQDATIRLWQVIPRTPTPALQTLVGHQGRIWAIAFSPDGQTLASGGEDCDLRLWDVATGRCNQTWKAHNHWVRSLAFSPNGQYLASSSYDLTIKLWDLQTPELTPERTPDCLQTFTGHSQAVTAIAFSPKGDRIASGSFDRTVKLWDVNTGRNLNTFFGHTSRLWTLAYHPNGQQIVSGGDDHATKFWDLRSGRCTKTLVGHTNAVLSLALSPDGQYLISGHEDQATRIWDIQKRVVLQTLREHTNRVWAVAFQPAGQQSLLASGSADYTIKLWDWQSGTCLKTLQGHNSWVWSVAFSPDGQHLASSSYDHTLKLWDVVTGDCLHTLQGHGSPVVSVAFSPCGKVLASSDFKGTIRLWNPANGDCLQTLTGHTNSAWSVSFSPTGETLLSASFDQTLKLWDVTTGATLQTMNHQGGAFKACFSANGEFMLSGGADRSLQLWQTETGKCIQTLPGHTDLIYALLLNAAPSKDADSSPLMAFSGGLDESIKVWDLTSQACKSTWRVPRPYEGMKVSGVQGLSEAQLMTLIALGSVE